MLLKQSLNKELLFVLPVTECLTLNLCSSIYAVLCNRQNTDWETDRLPGEGPGDILGSIDLQFFREFAVLCPLHSLAALADAYSSALDGLSLGAPDDLRPLWDDAPHPS